MKLGTRHRVFRVIDGDTFDITPPWMCFQADGNRVRIANYDAPELNSKGIQGYIAQNFKNDLNLLILNKEVVLVEAFDIDRGRLVCDVELDGQNLVDLLKIDGR